MVEYSSLPNIRPGRLIIFEENPHRVTLIWTGCLFNFEQNFHWVYNWGGLLYLFQSFHPLKSYLFWMEYPKKGENSSYNHINVQFCQNTGFKSSHSIGSLIIFSDKSPSGWQFGRVSYFLLDEYPTGSAI